jgi:hypothetical protein
MPVSVYLDRPGLRVRSFIQTANILDPHPAPIHHPNAISMFINSTSMPSQTRLQPIDKHQDVFIGTLPPCRPLITATYSTSSGSALLLRRCPSSSAPS